MIGWGYGWDMSYCGYGCWGGNISSGEGTRTMVGVCEDLAEIGWSLEVDSGECKEIVSGRV